MQQQGVQLTSEVIGQYKIEAWDDRVGHKLAKIVLVESQQFIDAARSTAAQLIIGGQGRLHIEIEQQYAQTRVRSGSAQIGCGGSLANTAFR
ncbi:hypothetical protein CDEF62S_04038 [Castellaniella defragrans]